MMRIKNQQDRTLISPISYAVFAGALILSTWICLFQFGTFVPIRFQYVITGATLLSFFLLFILPIRFKFINNIQNMVIGCILLVLTLWLIPLWNLLLVPSGGDMATHTYIARLIREYNMYPPSYEPVVPIQNFGSYFIGMPTIIAVVSMHTHLPVYRSALLVVIGTYGFFVLSVFILSRRYYGIVASFLTSISAILINIDTTYYLPWGGNPMVLSVAFLVTATFYGLLIRDKKLYTPIYIVPLIMLWGASFLTHYIPFIVSLYICSALGLVHIARRKKISLSFLSILAVGMCIIAIPFLTSLKIPSSSTLTYIRDWQQGDHGHVWRGSIYNALWSIPLYIKDRLGIVYTLITVTGIGTVLIAKSKDRWWYLIAACVIAVIIVNSQYWVLPLSPLLYPERTVTGGIAIWVFFTGSVYQALTTFLEQSIKKRTMMHILALSVFAGLIGWISIPYLTGRYTHVLMSTIKESSVTADDLSAFLWLSTNTDSADVIDNNYGDAGIWIPAIIYRKVTYNDAGPFDLDELYTAQKKLNPTLVYIGAKRVYTKGDHIRFTDDAIHTDQSYTLLYASGAARIYTRQ